MPTSFDAYVMVDWSAAASPSRGADSIWWALVMRQDGKCRLMERENPRTRALAMEQLADLLGGLADDGKRILAGFDFPFGYPAGFGKRMGFVDQPMWQATWALLDRLIEDGDDNGNNRFVCAGRLNEMAGHDDFPFWGHPNGHRYDGLAAKKNNNYGQDLPERRLVEKRLPGAKTVWQLNGAGSVGGQSLVGIPRLRALCADPRLGGRARIWPFETANLSPRPGDIIIAEIYPSIVPHVPEPGQVKDACQVRTIAEKLAEDDETGRLAGMIDLSDTLGPAEEISVRCEEGWILGVAGPT